MLVFPRSNSATVRPYRSSVIRRINDALPPDAGLVNDGEVSIWSLSVNGQWGPDLGGPVGLYVTAGIGIDWLDAELTDDALVYYPPVCDPWFWWCVPGGVGPGTVVRADEDATEFGWNAAGVIGPSSSWSRASCLVTRWCCCWLNIFFVMENEIVTPQLNGTILPGITRRSVLELGRHWGLPMVERRIRIEEVLNGVRQGTIKEIFGSGTAAVISPVGELSWKGESFLVGEGKTGPVAQRFFQNLTGIQYGEMEDPYGWMELIDE